MRCSDKTVPIRFCSSQSKTPTLLIASEPYRDDPNWLPLGPHKSRLVVGSLIFEAREDALTCRFRRW